MPSGGKLLKNLVIERHFPTNWGWWPIPYALVNGPFTNNADFAVEDSSYNDIPCFKVIVTKDAKTELSSLSPWLFKYRTISRLFPSQREIRYRNFTSEEFNRHKAELQKNSFAKVELWIGKSPDRPFIYQFRAFSPAGEIIETQDCGNISFAPQLNQKLFEIPTGAKVMVVKTHQEYSEAYIDNFTAGNIK